MKTILSLFLCFGVATAISAQCVKGNCFKGHGTYEWENGDFYEGMWKNGKPEGEGTLIRINRDKFEGKWKNNRPEGKGTIILSNGDKYVGMWKNGRPEGIWKKY